MFVRNFVHVDRPFEDVAPRFVTDTSWLRPLAEAASKAALEMVDALDARSVEPEPASSPIVGRSQICRLRIGPARARGSSLLVPVWLAADHAGAVLPDLTGDLEVAPVGPTRALVAFGATYQRPDPGAAATSVERATEAGVRRFLSGIAAALEQRDG